MPPSLALVATTFAAVFGGVPVFHWLSAHEVEIVGFFVAFIVACRAVPAVHWKAFEAAWPRLARVVQFCRAIWPDVVKAARVLWLLFRGTPFPLDTLDAKVKTAEARVRPTIPPLPLLLTLALFAAGCWRDAPRDCTTPGAFSCVNNTPMRCMSVERVNRPVTGLPCPPRTTCVLRSSLRSGVIAECVENVALTPEEAAGADAGADAATDASGD